MDTSIRRIAATPTAAPDRANRSVLARQTNKAFTTGSVNAVPDLGPRRFTVIDVSAPNGASLRQAIIDCAAQATAAEPVDTERRLLSFMARMSATMEGLGERELDAVLWDLTKTKSA